jgi:hypothetical protein
MDFSDDALRRNPLTYLLITVGLLALFNTLQSRNIKVYTCSSNVQTAGLSNSELQQQGCTPAGTKTREVYATVSVDGVEQVHKFDIPDGTSTCKYLSRLYEQGTLDSRIPPNSKHFDYIRWETK